MERSNTQPPLAKAFPFVPWISPSNDSSDADKERSRRLVRSHAARRSICYVENAFNIPMKDAPHGSHGPISDVSSSAENVPAVQSLYQSKEVPENVSAEDVQPHGDGPDFPSKRPCQSIAGAANQLVPIPNACAVRPPNLEYIAMEQMDPFRTSALGNLADDILEECLHYSSYPQTSLMDFPDLPGVSILWPNLIPGSRENGSMQAWSRSHIVEEATCFALSLGALSHKQSYSSESHDPERSQLLQRRLLYVEMESARAVNQALASRARPITDSLILSALCMANNSSAERIPPRQDLSPFRAPLRELQWLNIYAMNTANVAHHAGLYHLIQLRGGVNSIQLPGLAAILS